MFTTWSVAVCAAAFFLAGAFFAAAFLAGLALAFAFLAALFFSNFSTAFSDHKHYHNKIVESSSVSLKQEEYFDLLNNI